MIEYVKIQFFLKWPYVQFNPSGLIPLFMLTISIYILKIHLCEIINWIFFTVYYAILECVCFFRQNQIVWCYRCVKHPNWNKVYIDDINNKRDHRDIHKNKEEKKYFLCTFIYWYWSVYWVYLSIMLIFIGWEFLLFSLYNCFVNVVFFCIIRIVNIYQTYQRIFL